MTNRLNPPVDIGFVGLGHMGAPMASRLAAAGYHLHVFDADPYAVERFAADVECNRPGDLKSLAEASTVVITMLPEGGAVRKVLVDEGDNVLSGLKPGAVLIDMTSASPVGTRDLGAELREKGFPLIDAPVSGGVQKAGDGTLAIMAGGDPEIIEQVRPILDQMGKVFETGGPGTGHAMKALNNYLSAALLTCSAEAIIAGTQFGLDPQRMVEIFNASSGRSSATEHKYPNFVLPRTFDSGFALGLMAKDLRLALDVVHDMHTPSRLLENLSAIYNEAEESLGFSADNTDVVRYLEQLVEGDGES